MLVVYALFGRNESNERVHAQLGAEVVDLLLTVEGSAGGRASGHPRSVRLELGEPLHGRLLRDPVSRVTRVPFDGSRLVVPTALPPGWHLALEGSHNALGTPGDTPSHWYRDYSPVQRDGSTRARRTVILWQGRGSPYDLSVGDEWEVRGELQIGGSKQPVWRSRYTQGAIVTWPHAPADADLTLQVKAAGHGDPTMLTLAAFLDTLTVTTP